MDTIQIDLSKMASDSGEQPSLPPPDQLPPRRRRRTTWAILFLIAVVIVGGIIITSGGKADADGAAAEQPGLWTQIKRLVTSGDKELAGEADGRINFLLLGMGGLGHDGPYLTDTIILASLDPETKQVALLSIPRDLVIPIPGYGWRKINNANAYGEVKEAGSGPRLAAQTISSVFAVPIHYYVRVDFAGFREFIDEFGGIEVCVDNTFTDYQYPTADYGTQTIRFEEGCQKMDGETALQFARSRHGNNGEGSDFARSRRQQKVILATKEKVLSFGNLINPLTFRKLYGQYTDHVATNMELWELLRLANMVKDVDRDTIISHGLTEGPGGHLEVVIGEDGAFLLQPPGGNFDAIRDLVANILGQDTDAATVVTNQAEPEPVVDEEKEQLLKQATKENVSIEIRNGTFVSGLAGQTQSHLDSLGFDVPTTGNAPFRDFERTVIYNLSDEAELDTITYLTEELSANVATNVPSWVFNIAESDIVVIMGEAAANLSFVE